MAITRSQIARQLLQQGGVSMVDLECNIFEKHNKKPIEKLIKR